MPSFLAILYKVELRHIRCEVDTAQHDWKETVVLPQVSSQNYGESMGACHAPGRDPSSTHMALNESS